MVSPAYVTGEMNTMYSKLVKKYGAGVTAKAFGLKKNGSKVYWQSYTYKWYPIKPGRMYWFRGTEKKTGKGRWSEISPNVDKQRVAHKINSKYAQRHMNQGDLNPKRRL